MTTIVRVLAHCAHDKQVQIDYENNNGVQQETIQDGDVFDVVVYDGLSCTVKEVPQTEIQNGDGKTRPPPDAA